MNQKFISYGLPMNDWMNKEMNEKKLEITNNVAYYNWWENDIVSRFYLCDDFFPNTNTFSDIIVLHDLWLF